MKLAAIIACLAFTGGVVNGLVSPHNTNNQQKIQEASVDGRRGFLVQGIAAATAAFVGGSTAGTANAFEASTFNHMYNDPKHPNCKRIVQVKQDGFVQLSGTDGNPGCPEDGDGDIWRLQGELRDNTILVDFAPKVCIFYCF